MNIKEITLQFDENFFGWVFVFFYMMLFVFYIVLATKTQPLGEDEFEYMLFGVQMHEGTFTGFTSDGHPITAPLMLSFISSMLFNIFGEQLAVLKVVSTIFGLFAVLLLYFAVKKMKGIIPAILTSSLLMSMIIFSHFLLLGYVEDMIAFFSSLVIFILTRERNIKYAFLLGLAIMLAFFAKQSAMMLLPVVLIYFLWSKEWKANKKYLLITLIIPIAVWSIFILHNISVYKIPAVFILNDIWYKLYGNPYPATSLPEFQNVGQVFVVNLVPQIGFVPMMFICIGLFYTYSKEDKLPKIAFIAIIVFLMLSATMFFMHEIRYLSIIFPFMTLMTAGYWHEIKEFCGGNKKWIFYSVAVALVVFFMYESITTAIGTSTQQRWQPEYIAGLEWIKNNTLPNSTIFTAYGGSVYYYADRNYTWVTSKFPEIMRSNDTQVIYNDLIEQKVDYIYVWQGILGQDYVLPRSNLYGIFTINFLNNIQNDSKHFTPVFQNNIGVIFKVEKNESQSNISKSQ